MNIDPTPSSRISRPGSSPLRESSSGTPLKTDPDAARPAAAKDQVELSEAARALQQHGVPSGDSSLAPERLRQVLDRLTQGHYERGDVRDQVLRRLIGDLDIDSGP